MIRNVFVYASDHGIGRREFCNAVTQAAQLEQFARSRGRQITGTFIEPSISGRARKVALPMMMELVQHLEVAPRPVDLVLARDLSRFGRSAALAEHAIWRIHATGARLGLVWSGSEIEICDAYFASFVLANAKIREHRQSREAVLSRRCRESREAEQGFWLSGRPAPFGYAVVPFDVDPKRRILVPDNSEADLVGRMIDRALGGGEQGQAPSVGEIASWLNSCGLRTRRGKVWSRAAVARILSNPIYTGTYLYRADSSDRSGIPVPVPALVDQKTFAALQDALISTRDGADELGVRRHRRATPDCSSGHENPRANTDWAALRLRARGSTDSPNRGGD